MNPSFILALFAALLVGGAAIFAWPQYGPCLTHSGEVALTREQRASVACDQADLYFRAWDHGASLDLTCSNGERVSVYLSESSPTAVGCGVSFELVDHWEGGAQTEHQIALAYGW